MYELFDHTADLGIRVRAKTREELFAQAARALTAVLVERSDEVRPREEIIVELPADEPDYLFFDWLRALLLKFETQRFLPCQADVRFDERGLHATVRGERFDPRRHRPGHEVKAITYHGLKVQQRDGEWIGEVIVDI